MIDWNPHTYSFCLDCPYYRASAEYIYQLERDPKLRKCRFTAQCKRAVNVQNAGMQLTFNKSGDR
jgi:hypothetical protein